MKCVICGREVGNVCVDCLNHLDFKYKKCPEDEEMVLELFQEEADK